jgi:DNA polymerase-3 subunit epsilon
MKVLCVDSETTGLPRYDRPADDPTQPRICSLGYVLFDPEVDRGADLAVYDLIQPCGWIVPMDVVAIHGLSTEKLQTEGLPLREVLDRFMVAFELCDLIIGFNLQFDMKLLRGELRRDRRPDRYGHKPEICCMRASLPHCRIPPTHKQMAAGFRSNKNPTLAEAYEILLGKPPFAGAHNALTDAKATVELYRWLKAQGKLPAATWNQARF